MSIASELSQLTKKQQLLEVDRGLSFDCFFFHFVFFFHFLHTSIPLFDRELIVQVVSEVETLLLTGGHDACAKVRPSMCLSSPELPTLVCRHL